MSTSIIFPAPDGATYIIPAVDDENWGQNVSNFLIAIPAGVPPRNGTFALTGDLSFGPSFGLVSQYYKSATSNPASAGVLRLANIDAIEWRNAANTGNNTLNLSGDTLIYNGSALTVTALTNSHIFVGNISNTPTDVAMSGDTTITNTGVVTIANGAINNAKVTSGAAIAVNKLAAQTAHRAVATDSSGFLTPSSTTDTELGFVSGVTSSIQTQINNLATNAFQPGDLKPVAYATIPSGWLLCDGTSYTTASFPGLFAAIGYTYGGAGANFNVPNLVDNVPVGKGGSIVPSLGSTAGSTTVTVVQNAHNHTQDAHQHVTAVGARLSGNAIYTARSGAWAGGETSQGTINNTAAAAGNGNELSSFFNTTNTTATNQSTTATNQASSTVQPSIGINWLIKT